MIKNWLSRHLHKIGPGLRKILGNFGWLLVDRVVRLGLGLVVGIWVARYLGPLQFGSLNFAIAFVGLFASVATLGMDGIVIRDVIHAPEKEKEILGTTLALRFGAGLLSVGVGIPALHMIQPHDRQALVLVSILSATLLFQALDTIDVLFQSQVRSRITVWAKNSAFLIFAAIRVWLIYEKRPLWQFAVAVMGEAGLGAAGLLIGYRLSGGHIFAWRFSRRTAFRLLQQSWPALFSAIAIMVYMRIDMVMLKVMQGDFQVGLYSAATRVSEVWYFIPTAIASSVTPAIMKAKDDPALLDRRLRSLFSLMTVLACVVGAFVALASHLIIRTLYSSAYSGAAPVLAVHVWASVFVFLGVAQTPWDVANNLLKLSFLRTLSGACINIALNLILIPKFTAMGAAIATVVAYAIAAVFANAFNDKTRRIFYMQIRSFLPGKFWDLSMLR
jgi:PST family polysaccharide transporter